MHEVEGGQGHDDSSDNASAMRLRIWSGPASS